MKSIFYTVQFKDKNTGWKVVEEIINVANTKIKESILGNSQKQEDTLYQKGREDYVDINNGWILNWCCKNLVTNYTQ